MVPDADPLSPEPSSARQPLRVSWLMSAAVTPYRVPLLHRLGKDPSLELTVFHGGSEQPRPYGDVAIGPSVRIESLRNVYWRDGRRAALQIGISRFLRRPADVVIIQDITHNITNWLALVISRLLGRRIVLFGYGFRPQGISRRWAEGLRNLGRRVFVGLADAAATYTDAGKDAVALLGLPGDRIRTVENTLDTTYLMSLDDAETTEATARRLGVSGRPVVLFVGRLLRAKRIDVLMDAFRLVRESVPDAALVIVGEGEESHLIEPGPDVVVVGEMYDPPALAPIFGLASVLAIPGRIGLTCVHAFAYGVPVVTCHEDLVEQSPEYAYISPGTNGMIVGELSAQAVATALISIINNADLRAQLSGGALTTAERLNMDHTAAEFSRAIHIASNARR